MSARRGFSAEEDPVRGKAELRGYFQNPAVGDLPLAARLTHRLRRHAENFGELTVAAKPGPLKETIESIRCCVAHEVLFKEKGVKSQLEIKK